MVLPEVIGYKLTGQFPPQATATDLVLAITKALRGIAHFQSKYLIFFCNDAYIYISMLMLQIN